MEHLQHNTTTSPAPTPSHSGSSYDPSSATVTALVLFSFLSFLGFFSVYTRRALARDRSRRHERTLLARSSFAAKGLDPGALRALPVLPYSAGTSAASECVVCLSEFEEGDGVKAIPSCGHFFHPQCIDAWLASQGSCPVCRFDVTVEGKEHRSRSWGPSSPTGDRPAAVAREGMVLPWSCRRL